MGGLEMVEARSRGSLSQARNLSQMDALHHSGAMFLLQEVLCDEKPVLTEWVVMLIWI